MNPDPLDAFFGYGPGHDRARRQVEGPMEGTVLRVTAAGAYFRLNDGDMEHLEFGPAKWNRARVDPNTHTHGGGGEDTHGHTPTEPAAGALCLVVFVGPGVERPWLLAWW